MTRLPARTRGGAALGPGVVRGAAAAARPDPRRAGGERDATEGTTSERRREQSLNALATLLSLVPHEHRMWVKVLVYISRDAKTHAPSLNLVLAHVENPKTTPDAFLVSAHNPYVTIVPRLPGGLASPERLSVDVRQGGDEITFRVARARAAEEAEAGRPRLEIWYGPSLVRTVRMPNPFEG